MNPLNSLKPTRRLAKLERLKPRRGCLHSAFERLEAAAHGFTIIELLVVIAIIGILAALLLPVLGKGKSRGQQVACVNNFHQLTLSWKMYADENGGKLVSIFYFLHGAVNSNAWVRGSMNDDTKIYPPVDPGVKDSTNMAV
jgi:prepilin-type N-terminal cleavage/methylation domain-containing protein